MIYTEIFKLQELLEMEHIPFEFVKAGSGFQLLLFTKGGVRLCDAIETEFSYGNEADKLEIMGALTEEEYKADRVLGWLTAEEVFKRFKYCYENNTSIYVKVGD